MKKSNFGSPKRAAKAVCTVSAAALMLGVSQAATVGLHFQVHYCYDGRYTGFPVTMTAFGVGTNSWENLQQMNTGYGCGGGTPPYTLSAIISTTTSTEGLNPLPNGSLSVTWSADTANFSGFAGYGGSLPGYDSFVSPTGYDYGGPTPPNRTPAQPFPTGEWEVYSSFLRDGVNFGPGSSGGDNSQPGYSVDITGLKSVFTNSPFVIELIAASDSMQNLTNAFIIDATANTTNSVTYPATPFPSVNWGGTLGWFRGHGGGLSTVSSPLNTDHVKIIGNRAAHGVNPAPNGFDNASTISGFIATDKPVVTMSPQSVLACKDDTVTLDAYAIGVPPLSYQWRKNGVPIPGATTPTNGPISISSVTDGGNFDLVVTNLYGATTSAVAVVTVDQIALSSANNFVIDSNPTGIENDGYNSGATWLASSTDGASTTRTGVMSFTAASSNQIVVPGVTNYDSTNGTIMFWMRSAGVLNGGSGPATLFDRLTNNNGLLIEQNPDGSVGVSNAGVVISTSSSSSDNNWHHIAIVFDQTVNGYADIYVDGVLQASAGNIFGGWSWQPGQVIQLGLSQNTSQPFNGVLDDVRLYNRPLTVAEIQSVFGSNALVDTNALVLRLNFDGPPSSGFILNWQSPDAVLQSANTVNGPYTDLPGVVSPYHPPILTQKSIQFYRYRHTPAALISNPYLM